MSDQKHFRSDEARKNYEKNEKLRAQAQKRKARQAQSSQAKSWLKQNPLKAAIAAVVVIAVIVLVWLGCKALFNPLRGQQDNWLIFDVTGKENFQHVANFDVPAGYTKTGYSLYTDGVSQDFYCEAEDETVLVQDVYVTGAKGVNAADYPATVLAYGLHKEAGEPRTLTINGVECSALYLVSDESEYSGDGLGIAHMSFYFDIDGSACVSATFRSGTLPFEELPDEETLLAAAEAILTGLTMVK